MVRLALALAILTSCSYGASFEDCRVACRAADECPSGFECGDGLCRPIGGGGQSCASVLGDAQNNNDDGASAGSCTGTPAACASFIPMSDCLGHGGCTYTTSSCTRTVDCTAIGTNQQCMNTPGCQTDFTTSTCKHIPSYCHGLDKEACETLQAPGECAFAGGCAGTPAPCESYTDRSTCVTTDGCDFE